MTAEPRKRKSASNWLTQVIIALLLAAAYLWVMRAGSLPKEVVAQRDCEHQYAAARTPADTERVDHQPLAFARPGRDSIVPTCGTLRATGRLK